MLTLKNLFYVLVFGGVMYVGIQQALEPCRPLCRRLSDPQLPGDLAFRQAVAAKTSHILEEYSPLRRVE